MQLTYIACISKVSFDIFCTFPHWYLSLCTGFLPPLVDNIRPCVTQMLPLAKGVEISKTLYHYVLFLLKHPPIKQILAPCIGCLWIARSQFAEVFGVAIHTWRAGILQMCASIVTGCEQLLTKLQILSHDSFHISTAHVCYGTQVNYPIVFFHIGKFLCIPVIAVNIPTFLLVQEGCHISTQKSQMSSYKYIHMVFNT